RGVPGEDRHPVGPRRPAGAGGRRSSWRPAAQGRVGRDAGGGLDLVGPTSARAGRADLGSHGPLVDPARRPAWPGMALDGSSRPSGAAARVLPRVVETEPGMTARDDILDRVRAALADAPVAPSASAPRRTPDPGLDVVALFCERVADYRAEV